MTNSWRRIIGSVLFPCPTPSYTIDSFPSELVWIPAAPAPAADAGGGGGAGTGEPDGPVGEPRPRNGDTVPCLLLPYESARFLIIFFHSNAEDLGRCRWFCQFLRDQFQVHVLGVEYPGYGICAGPPSREGVIANAEAALHFATDTLGLPLEQIKIIGRSIGTGPAVHLASRYKVSGLVLVTPFLNIRSLFYDRVGPLSYIVDEWFENDREMRGVTSPTMFIHGRKDQIIPFRHGETLYKSCIARKLFITPAGMEHNSNLTADASFLIVPMFRFFALPDYCFRELKVPAWAYDKRRSPLYRKPDIEVSSRRGIPPTNFGGLVANMPEGDDEELPVNPDAEPWCQNAGSLQGRARCSQGDTPIVDFEKVAVLTHPTVLHRYRATKQSYSFETTSLRPREEGPQDGQLGVLRQRPLGDHTSASQPIPGSPGSRPRPPRPGAGVFGGVASRLPQQVRPQPEQPVSPEDCNPADPAGNKVSSSEQMLGSMGAHFWGPGEVLPISPPPAFPLADVAGARGVSPDVGPDPEMPELSDCDDAPPEARLLGPL